MILVREALARSVEQLYRSDIRDENFEAVTRLFVENGYEWHVDQAGVDGLYDQSPGLEYCGHTVGVAGRQIGKWAFNGRCVDVQLDPQICKYVLASTVRLGSQKWWSKAGHSRVEGGEPCRGAVCTVRDDKHIVTALEAPRTDGTFRTIEGNTTGRLVDKTTGKGVVARRRSTDEVNQVYIFGPEHCHGNSEIFRRETGVGGNNRRTLHSSFVGDRLDD